MARKVTAMSVPLGNHHLRREDAGDTLVEVLVRRARNAGTAWQEANDLVRGHRVQVDGNTCADPARLMRPGEVVKVLPHARAPQARPTDVQVVFADEHLAVIDKPPAVTTLREPGHNPQHPPRRASRGGAGRQRQATLEEMVALLLHRKRDKRSPAGQRRDPPVRRKPGTQRSSVYPVHRLDRDTSGLMLFARTPAAERALLGQFKARQVHRSYLAVVHGHPPAMTITTHLVRDRGDGLRGSAQAWGLDPAGGQRAVTHIEPLEEIGAYSVVRCTLETGRTHQIRIHLSEAGHMLCGEREYTNAPGGARVRDQSGAPRQALHADRLSFTHPMTGREMRFTRTLAPDLARWLESLR
jgi:23S rRNA pseudouridine1911/1915/1917 synthase